MSEDKDSKTDKTEGEGNGSQKSSYGKKGRRKKRPDGRFESSGNTFKGLIPELKDHVFTYTGNIRAKKWLKAIEAFISYAGGKYGKDVRATLTKMEVTIITAKAPASHDRETIKALMPFLEAKNWEFDIKEYRIAAKELEDNLAVLFDKLWAQCGLGMQNKRKSHIGWKSAVKKSNVIELLEIIDEICSSGDQSKYAPVQIFLSNKKLHNFQQADNQSLTKCHEEFDMLVRMAGQHGNTYSISNIEELIIRSQTDPNIKEKSMSKLSTDIQEVISENAREVYLATIFIMNASDTKYGAYKQSLYNNYCQGDDRYPKSVADVCTMLDNSKFNLKLCSMRTPVVGHTYLSQGKKEKNEESEGTRESDSSQDDNGGHIATICKAIEHIDGTTIGTNSKKGNNAKDKEQQRTGAMMLIDQSDSESDGDDTKSHVEDYLDELDYNYQIGWTNFMKGITKDHKEAVVEDVRRNKKHEFNQSRGRINPYWVLLDNQLTVHVFCQKAFLTNIREAPEESHLYTNAGIIIITHVGDLPGFGSVWFHPEGIANVLSFDGVAKTKGYMIKYNNLTMGNYFRVTDPSGEVKIFRPSWKGLYYWDIGTVNIYLQEAQEQQWIQ
eukprot:jgi/Psemu1/29984/gm1.29984_g